MGRKKIRLLMLICGLLSLLLCFPIKADGKSEGGETVTKVNGQTDIVVGVAVDYMWELRFLVLNKENDEPIEGVSVEIYIPSLYRYVLFGITDKDGVYELSAASGMVCPIPDDEPFVKVDGNDTSDGTLVYLIGSDIRYRVYKAGWYPYAYYGSYLLTGKELPETIIVKLSRAKIAADTDGKETILDNVTLEEDPLTIVPPLDIPPSDLGYGTDTIPKTGVEGAVRYWTYGLCFFLIAGGANRKLLRMNKESSKTKRRD